MKLKIFILAFASAMLATACNTDNILETEDTHRDKDGTGTEVAFPDGSFDVTIAVDPEATTRTIMDEEGRVKWVATDELGAHALEPSTPWDAVVGQTPHKFSTSQQALKNDGMSAEFSATGISEGDYVFFYPYTGGAVNTGNTGIQFIFPVNQVQAGASLDHIYAYDVMVSENHVHITESGDAGTVNFAHIYAMVDFPVKLTSPSESPITISGITVSAETGTPFYIGHTYYYSMASETYEVTPNTGWQVNSLSLNITGDPVLSADTEFTAHMLLPAVNHNGNITITVTTSLGDFSIVKPSVAFEASKRYTARGLDIDPSIFSSQQEIGGASDWESAVQKANEMGVAEFVITSSFELDASSTMPDVPMILKGTSGTALTIKFPSTSSARATALSASPDADYYIPSKNPQVILNNDLTLEGPMLVLDGGMLYGKNLTLSGNSSLRGTGRIILSEDFTVSGGSSTLQATLTLSCDKLVNSGSMTNSGRIYCNSTGGTAVSGNAAVLKSAGQVKNSNFDDWFEQTIYATVIGGKAWFPGKSKSDIIWASGNGSHEATTWGSNKGGTGAIADPDPTRPSSTHKVAGTYSAMMTSGWIGGFAQKFAAGNIFLGTFDRAVTSPKTGARFTFGYGYTHMPVSISGYFDYETSYVDYEDNKSLSTSKNYFDECNIYIALTTKSYSIDTTADEMGFPDLEGDSAVIAYGNFSTNNVTAGFKKFHIDLTYKNFTTVPTHILIVASSSINGDSFTGSSRSVLYLDELELDF